MTGWKTWLSAAGLMGLGVYHISVGQIETGIESILAGLALVGIGHKVEKVAKNSNVEAV